ncbi:MAG: DUF1592 domain-containing protein [Myxococcota bacterium]
MSRLVMVRLFAAVAILSVVGCQGVFGEVGTSQRPTDEPLEPPITPPVIPDVTCRPDEASASSAPIRRLGAREYRNTVAQLFPGIELPPVVLQSDTGIGGFSTNASGQGVTAQHVEAFALAAETIAEAATDLQWAPCRQGPNCASEIALTLGERAYRRPLTSEEELRFTEFMDEAMLAEDLPTATRMFVTSILQSPSFLYRPEFGDADGQLTSYELASRLAYALWQTAPDEALLEAAGSGQLDSSHGLLEEVQKMLIDERAARGVQTFHREWMHVEAIDEVELDDELFPEFGPALKHDLVVSYDAFLFDVFQNGGLDALFNSSRAFVTPRTAALFGVPVPSEDLAMVELDPSERRGVLTHPGYLVSTMSESFQRRFHSPIFRSVNLMSQLLCTPPPSAPANVDFDVDGDESAQVNTESWTTRQKFEASHQKADCISCHASIDAIGFTFEHYDVLGRYRTEENGSPVDASTNIVGFGDLNGPVQDVMELSERMADSPLVRACVARNWYRFLYGRTETDASGDQCELAQGRRVLEESGGDLRALVEHYLTAPSFTALPPSE